MLTFLKKDAAQSVENTWRNQIRFRFATTIIFFVNGFTISSWIPHIPYIKQKLNLSASQLGIALLIIPLGAVVSMMITGALVPRTGTRNPAVIGAVIACIALIAILFSGSYLLLLSSLLLLGLANGVVDITMNTDGVEVEKSLQKPVMSSLHAAFSVGGLSGAAFGVGSMSLGFSQYNHIIVAAMLGVLLMFAYGYVRPRNWCDPKKSEQHFVLPNLTLLPLCCLTFLILATEGVITDWSGVYLNEIKGVNIESSGIGYVVFSLAMVAGRLSGDYIVRALGRLNIVRIGAFIATIGFATILFSSSLMLTMLGFTFLGLGISNITPVFFSCAGDQKQFPPSVALAAISTVGYLGFLVSPPVVGFAADWVGLDISFSALAVFMLIIILTAKRVLTITKESV